MIINEGKMPFMGFETYYRIVGAEYTDKTPLMLLHGGPGSTHNYFEVLDFLAEKEQRRFVMYDQIGCGGSYVDGHPELWTRETWVREFMALREYLGLTDIHLLGQSWGGMLALEYICNYPHDGIRSLILSSTLPSSRLWGEEQARMIKELPAEMQAAIQRASETGDYEAEDVKAAEAEYMLRHCSGPFGEDAPECLTREKRAGKESYITGWGPNEFTPLGTLKDYDVTDKLCQIKEPALIISGGNDLCTPFIAKTMFDAIPNSRWELFRTCRHSCYVEDLPRYASLISEWMKQYD